MRTSGIYLPNGESESRPFRVTDDNVTVMFPNGQEITLPKDGADRWASGFDSVERFVGRPDGLVMVLQTRDKDRNMCRVSLYEDGSCIPFGRVHAMVQ